MTDDEELRAYARDVIERVNAGESVLLDPEMEARLIKHYHGFRVMDPEETLRMFSGEKE